MVCFLASCVDHFLPSTRTLLNGSVSIIFRKILEDYSENRACFWRWGL